MFKGFDDVRTVTESGIFFLCCIFQIQTDLGRAMSPEEWEVWTNFLNKEMVKRRLAIYD